MPRPKLLAGGLATAGVVLLLGVLFIERPSRREDVPPRAPTILVKPTRDLPPAPRRAADPPPEDGRDPQFRREFASRTTDIREACDLPLEMRCDSSGCAAVVESPDLDVFTGWLQILTDRPGLVASTLLRDAGVDPSLLPCGRALDRLGDQPIYSVTDPDTGREWWCTAGGPAPHAHPRSLCDEVVAEQRGAPFAGFSVSEPRQLQFRR